MREVLLWTGAGQIGMAIARRVGYGKTVVVGDRSLEHAQAAAGVMNAAGFDVIPVEMDLSSRASIQALIREKGIAAAVSQVCELPQDHELVQRVSALYEKIGR